MRKHITFVGLLFLSFQFVDAQNMPKDDDVSLKIESQSNKFTEDLTKELSLNAEQSQLVNKKESTYNTIRRKILRSKLSKKRQSRKLRILGMSYDKEIRGFMDSGQFKRYAKLVREKRRRKEQELLYGKR